MVLPKLVPPLDTIGHFLGWPCPEHGEEAGDTEQASISTQQVLQLIIYLVTARA